MLDWFRPNIRNRVKRGFLDSERYLSYIKPMQVDLESFDGELYSLKELLLNHKIPLEVSPVNQANANLFAIAKYPKQNERDRKIPFYPNGQAPIGIAYGYDKLDYKLSAIGPLQDENLFKWHRLGLYPQRGGYNIDVFNRIINGESRDNSENIQNSIYVFDWSRIGDPKKGQGYFTSQGYK